MSVSYEKRHLATFTWHHKRLGAPDNTVGLVRNILVNTAQVNSVGAGLTTLHSFSLDAPNRLRKDGDYLNVWYGGSFASNDNDKRVNATFGGTAYENSGLFDIDGNTGWSINARITRLSSTSVLVSHLYAANQVGVDNPAAPPPTVTTFGNGFVLATRNTIIAGLPDLGLNAITMAVQGQGGANNDVFQNLSIIEIVQN